jgi:hypothetical protein
MINGYTDFGLIRSHIMQRRDFLQMMAAAGVVAVTPLPGVVSKAVAQPGQYNGPLLITFHLRGGWDQGSLADPRENPNINRWAQNRTAGRAGNLRYAPLSGQAQAFYEKYFQSLMVVNGVDLQTNGHGGGANHRNTGSLGSSYPSTSELLAAVNGRGMPMPFVNIGRGFRSRGVMSVTNAPGEDLLRTLATPNMQTNGNAYIEPAVLDTVKQFRLQRLQRLKERTNNLPRWQTKYGELSEARNGSAFLDNLAKVLPTQLDTQLPNGTGDGLVKPLHLTLVTMAAGMTVSANLGYGNWDSHRGNDNRQAGLLNRLLGLLDYIMSRAAQVGIADRLYVHVTSDVGRTPRYNGNNGKDHWPVSSDLLLKANAPWANRHVGLSAANNTGRQPISFQTLAADDNGRLLHPEHVLNELRIELGIDQNQVVQRYPLTDQRFPLFDPGVSSNIPV